MQKLLATWLRLQFLQLTNEFGAYDEMSKFLFTLRTGLDIIDISSKAATTPVILVVIQGCVMPRMCYVAPKALPKLDLSRVPTPHTGRPSYTFQIVLVGTVLLHNNFLMRNSTCTQIPQLMALIYFRIRDVMIRIRIRGSGSRSGSCFFFFSNFHNANKK